jgi:hypothetical protein
MDLSDAGGRRYLRVPMLLQECHMYPDQSLDTEHIADDTWNILAAMRQCAVANGECWL